MCYWSSDVFSSDLAFVMASFLGIPYVDIAIAAIIPSLLYYLGLFMQIDAYAARRNLAGLPREELPKVGQAMKEGGLYISVFAIIVWMLVFLRQEIGRESCRERVGEYV